VFRGKESFPDCRESTRILSLDEYSERMHTAAIMLAQLNANRVRESASENGQPNIRQASSPQANSNRILVSSWINSTERPSETHPVLLDNPQQASGRLKLQQAEASAIRDRIMKEMLALEEERMSRMRENSEVDSVMSIGDVRNNLKSAEDENIIRRELNKADPSAVVFSESWAAKKVLSTHWPPCNFSSYFQLESNPTEFTLRPFRYLKLFMVLDILSYTAQPIGTASRSLSKLVVIFDKSSSLFN